MDSWHRSANVGRSGGMTGYDGWTPVFAVNRWDSQRPTTQTSHTSAWQWRLTDWRAVLLIPCARRTVKAYSVRAHEVITSCMCSTTDKLLVKATLRILMTLTCLMSGRAGGGWTLILRWLSWNTTLAYLDGFTFLRLLARPTAQRSQSLPGRYEWCWPVQQRCINSPSLLCLVTLLRAWLSLHHQVTVNQINTVLA